LLSHKASGQTADPGASHRPAGSTATQCGD